MKIFNQNRNITQSSKLSNKESWQVLTCWSVKLHGMWLLPCSILLVMSRNCLLLRLLQDFQVFRSTGQVLQCWFCFLVTSIACSTCSFLSGSLLLQACSYFIRYVSIEPDSCQCTSALHVSLIFLIFFARIFRLMFRASQLSQDVRFSWSDLGLWQLLPLRSFFVLLEHLALCRTRSA